MSQKGRYRSLGSFYFKFGFDADFNDHNIFIIIREAFKSNFWKNLGIWPNQVDPPLAPQKLGRPKLKKKIDVYFAF